jgi:DNA-binding transcriptional LysR family regulator
MSFNKAVDRLHHAQSSISAQVHALEEERGVQLFDRLGKKARLTETGEQLLGQANKVLNLIDETRSEITTEQAEDPRGPIPAFSASRGQRLRRSDRRTC